ncbi:MAG: formylglycine-generating enzyme family protein [Leptonema sp. (in: bacteria)]
MFRCFQVLFYIILFSLPVFSEKIKNYVNIGIVLAKRSEDFYTIQINEEKYFNLLQEMPNTILYLINLNLEVEVCLKAVSFYQYNLKFYIHSIKVNCKDHFEAQKKIQLGDFVFIATSFVESQKQFVTKKETKSKIIVHPIDFKEMIYVEEDYLLFGQGKDWEDPSYNLYYYNWNLENIPKIRSFYIDKYEVTNYEFFMFCQKSGYPCQKFLYNLTEEEKYLPYIYATYKDVEEYAKWSKKEIPTEWEWELAAKGGLNSFLGSTQLFAKDLFDEYPSDLENCNTLEKWENHPKPISVYNLKDINFRGIVGMCGNALEWTSSFFLPYPGNRFKNEFLQRISGKFYRVLKGGSFFLPKEYAKVYKRTIGGFPLFNHDPIGGFRLILRSK